MYLTLEGETLPTAKGDRIMRKTPHAGAPQSCYVMRRDYQTGDVTYHVAHSATSENGTVL
jgi:hypothetical protein